MLKRCFGLVQISALEQDRTVRQVVALEFGNAGHASKREGFGKPLLRAARNLPDILFDVFQIQWPLIDLDDVPTLVNQKRGGKAQVAMPVVKVSIEDVVNRGNVLRTTQNGQRQLMLACQHSQTFRAWRVIKIDRYQLQPVGRPSRQSTI